MEQYLKAKLELQKLLEPFDDKTIHINNIDLARLTFPYNTIPYNVKPEKWEMLIHDDYALNKYMISSWGRIFNIIDAFYLTTHICDKGYLRVAIELSPNTKNIKPFTSVRVHRLVGHTFLHKDLKEETINHIDLNKKNATIENLEYMSFIDNVKHGYANNAKPKKIYNFFTKQDIDNIKLKYKQGYTITSIAAEYKRKTRCISDIVNNKTYTETFWDKMNIN